MDFRKTTFQSSLWKAAIAAAILVLPATGASWTDRAEYDLVLRIRTEASPQKKLALLDQWKAKFPNSGQRQARRELYIAAYESLGDGDKVLQTAQEMLADEPESFVGAYWCVAALPGTPSPTPAQLAAGEKAARQLLSGLNTYFADSRRPQPMAAEAWQKQKAETEILSRRALGWIQWQRGDFAAAEKELAAGLQASPSNAELSMWLGTVLALQKQPDKQTAALWSLARAASQRGDGALTESQRKQVSVLLDKMYLFYHGEPGGLEQLLASSAKSVAPPVDFRIESAAEVADRRMEEKLAVENPMLLEWVKIRRKLDAADGEAFFNQTLSKAPLPKLKGTVIRWSPEGKPDSVVLGMSSAGTEEVTLQFAAPFPNAPEPGTELQFEGTPVSYAKSPFQVTVSVEKTKVEGWPAPSPARKK